MSDASAGRLERGEGAVGIRCENCKMTVDHEPFRSGERTFCCEGCGSGGPCIC